MNKRSTPMNSIVWLRVALALSPIAFASLTGCQSMLSRGKNTGEMTARQQSLAETPLARAKAQRAMSNGPSNEYGSSKVAAGSSGVIARGSASGVAANQSQVPASATTAKQQSIQQASATQPKYATAAEVSSKNGVIAAGGSSDVKSQVVPAQFADSQAEKPVDSFSVPREPMPGASSGYGPSAGIAPMGPGSRNQSGFQVGQYAPLYTSPAAPSIPGPKVHQPHGPHAGHGQPGHSCPTCNHGTGAYSPMFPQFNGMNGGGEACPPDMLNQGAGYQSYLPPPRQYDPQEHLFDGGDHKPLVRVRQDNSLAGLDPEDTVVQYQTVDGETHVESGCRVAIYAPRFASVRKRVGTAQNDFAQRLRTTDRPDGPGMVIEKLPSHNLAQPIKSQNKEMVRVVEAVRDRKSPIPAESVLPMLEVGDILQPYADIALFRTGVLTDKDEAKLAVGLANARAWVQVEELNVFVDGQEAIETSSALRAQGVVVYDHKGARIRLCKVASEYLANPGDVVSFTIRVDNTGEQPLSNLVITDSLTPRLEFIDGTDKSSLNATFSKTPNTVGSEILRWEISDVLKPGEGGVVRFDCRVR